MRIRYGGEMHGLDLFVNNGFHRYSLRFRPRLPERRRGYSMVTVEQRELAFQVLGKNRRRFWCDEREI
jgi:hypothetical protein